MGGYPPEPPLPGPALSTAPRGDFVLLCPQRGRCCHLGPVSYGALPPTRALLCSRRWEPCGTLVSPPAQRAHR